MTQEAVTELPEFIRAAEKLLTDVERQSVIVTVFELKSPRREDP